MTQPALSDVIAREGRVVAHCLRVIDRGLRRCNAALETLQPKQPGRITLLETTAPVRGKLQLDGTRWRVVRWRIRRSFADGTVEWQAVPLPLKGASRRTSSKFGFHDTEPEVREALRAAVALIEWRARVLQTAANFVTGMASHNRFGLEQASKNIERAAQAADRGTRKRGRIRQAAEALARVRERESQGD